MKNFFFVKFKIILNVKILHNKMKAVAKTALIQQFTHSNDQQKSVPKKLAKFFYSWQFIKYPGIDYQS